MDRFLGNRIRRIKRSIKVKIYIYLNVSDLRGSIISIKRYLKIKIGNSKHMNELTYTYRT